MAGFDYNAYNAARPGAQQATQQGFDYNAYNAARPGANTNTSATSGSIFNRTGNPEADAQTYAKQNGISVEEAKTKLRATYGDPQQGGASSSSSIFSGSTSGSTGVTSTSDSGFDYNAFAKSGPREEVEKSTNTDSAVANFRPTGNYQNDLHEYMALTGKDAKTAKYELENKYGVKSEGTKFSAET